VAGCATGEEAFSIAISLQEYLNETGAAFPVQIFASDISQSAIEKARTGRYLENITADITHDRLTRFFTKIQGGYQINQNLRELCVFSRHNMFDDPPFSNLDLISCRNMLICLESVQGYILRLFHYALKPTGFLMLGESEAMASNDLFAAADREHRIYVKRESAQRLHLLSGSTRGGGRGAGAGASVPVAQELWDIADVRIEVDRILLSTYSAACVVLDEDLEVIEIRGNVSPYLTLPPGKMRFNLAKLIPNTGLFLEVEKLVQQTRENGEAARQERILYERDGNVSELAMETVPLKARQKGLVLVLFEPSPGAAKRETQPPAENPKEDIRDRQLFRLKQQLADAKQRFPSGDGRARVG
jgi:two-component system CheB/CheR fusion protein